ncbi:MAG: hypothetical protein ACTTKH_03845 [Treponema sp.]
MLIAEYNYDTDIRMQRGEAYNIGVREGFEKGKIESTVSLAKSFRNIGIPLYKISEATGLTEEEIKAL